MQTAQLSFDMTHDGYGYVAVPLDPSKPSIRIECVAHSFFARDENKRLLIHKETGLPIDRYGVAITARASSQEKAFFEKYIHATDIRCAVGRETETLLVLASTMIDEMVKQWERKGYTLHRTNEVRARTPNTRRPSGNTISIRRRHAGR